METKKILIVLVLRVLEGATDETNPLTQVAIAEAISSKYPCDRKTVGRNIKFLKELGYPIVKTQKGFYMDRRAFTQAEVQFVLDAVKHAEAPEGIHRRELSDRLRERLCFPYKI